MKNITLKNYSLGILSIIVVMFILGWVSSGFALDFFTNWKSLLILVAVGFSFGLFLTPLALANFDVFQKGTNRDKKKVLLISLVFWVAFTVADIIIDYLTGQPVGFKEVASSAITNIFIVGFAGWLI